MASKSENWHIGKHSDYLHHIAIGNSLWSHCILRNKLALLCMVPLLTNRVPADPECGDITCGGDGLWWQSLGQGLNGQLFGQPQCPGPRATHHNIHLMWYIHSLCMAQIDSHHGRIAMMLL